MSQSKTTGKADRAKLDAFVKLFEHASMCDHHECVFSCKTLKNMMEHYTNCPMKATTQCIVCRRVNLMAHAHACTCKDATCTVFLCRQIRISFFEKQIKALLPVPADGERAGGHTTC